MEQYVVYCVDSAGRQARKMTYRTLRSAERGYVALAEYLKADKLADNLVEVCLYHEPYGIMLRSTSEKEA